MVSIPPTIPPVPDPAIASFPAADLASGTGLQIYYAVSGQTSAGQTYGLTEDTEFGSWNVTTLYGQPSSDPSFTLTFDSIPFNLPRYVKGIAKFKARIYQVGCDGVDVSAVLQHWDGSNVTPLTAIIKSGDLSGNGNQKNVYLELPITTQKMIKKGDQIRLVLVGSKNGASGSAAIGHDPSNGSDPSGWLSNTQMVIGIPFRVGA